MRMKDCSRNIAVDGKMKKILLGGAMAGLMTTTAYAFCMLPEDPTSACTMLMGSNDDAFYSCMQMADINFHNAMNQYNECEERELDRQLQPLPPSYSPPTYSQPRYSPQPYSPPPAYSAPDPPAYAPAPQRIEDVAAQVIINLLSGKSNNAEDYRIFYATPSILYYDKYIPTDQVIQDMQVYLSRWPQRDSKVTDIKATCESNTSCNVMGTISFQADASKRRSVGTASFQYHLMNDLRGHLLIDSVNGKPLTRQISNK
jgi:hypothetical protein